jgi:hypothetical protein
MSEGDRAWCIVHGLPTYGDRRNCWRQPGVRLPVSEWMLWYSAMPGHTLVVRLTRGHRPSQCNCVHCLAYLYDSLDLCSSQLENINQNSTDTSDHLLNVRKLLSARHNVEGEIVFDLCQKNVWNWFHSWEPPKIDPLSRSGGTYLPSTLIDAHMVPE